MKRHVPIFRATSVMLLIVYLHSIVLSGLVHGQEQGCTYDHSNPSLESARKSFLALNYSCAEQELNDLLKVETLTTQEKADAHVLLAEVYYAKVRNEGEKKTKVTEEFVKAFRAYREWRGELNIKSPEFISLMKEAQNIVDSEAAQPQQAEQPPVVEEKVTRVEEPAKKEGKKKPWYTQWWAIGLGVGVVAGGVLLLAGGGGGEEGGGSTVPDTLGYFPDVPPGK
jgi:hypothetical protein